MSIDTTEFERLSVFSRTMKAVFVNPLINYVVPRKLLRNFLYNCGSPMAKASIDDPGGWQSMVIAYDNPEPANTVDKMIMRLGSFPMGLRNRKRLAGRTLRDIMDGLNSHGGNLVGIGAGAAHNVLESMASSANKRLCAHCIDLNKDAFDHGSEMVKRLDLEGRVTYIHGNATDVKKLVEVPPDVVTCIGILEYLTDEQILDIFGAMHAAAGPNAVLLANSIENTHGTDRFLRTIFNLQLTYRNPTHVRSLMEQGGFRITSEEAEPMKIYHILVAQKE